MLQPYGRSPFSTTHARSRLSSGKLLIALAIVICLVLLGIGLVWQQVRLVSLRYEIMAIQEEIQKIYQPEIEKLEMEVARLESPVRLQKLASQFGLVARESERIVYVSDGTRY